MTLPINPYHGSTEALIMRYTALLTLVLALAGCDARFPETAGMGSATPAQPAQLLIKPVPGASPTLPGQLAIKGPAAARELKEWYDATPAQCGGPDKPAHLCSGILLRATDTNPAFQPWDPSPGAIKLGGVSFSWLRRDQTFSSTWEDWNGFILYPGQAIPEGKIKDIAVLCSFPTNALTWNRPTLQGCGPMENVANTDTCQNLGIFDAATWLEKYRQGPIENICGWDIRQGSGPTASWFDASLKAHQGRSASARMVFNELMLSTWETGKGATLPLHSFFYPSRSVESRAKARIDQARYYQAFGQVLPIIRLALPRTADATTVISFLEGDQALGAGVVHYSANFEDMPKGPAADVISGGLGFSTALSTQVEISDAKQDTPYLSGNYLQVNLAVDFPVDAIEGAGGKRKVAFSWGCDASCSVTELHSGRTTQLLEDEDTGPLRFGRVELQIQPPEVIRLQGGWGDRIILDNLTIE
ncbi:hypothetical protein F3J44_14475 [Pantoea sp. Tr-811]|uniref:hypothetical protein n=1 Tax=Pantoea sp. Tr-811 TaxID=2608361 RepID=UPI00141E57A0|nr:hypothetical protein [Pantoea sp. Tr-811]NIF27572.1 hypothetical protein [Pantoea sp. Tr-811]